jgi:hypothetical protein
MECAFFVIWIRLPWQSLPAGFFASGIQGHSSLIAFAHILFGLYSQLSP